jgi:threonine aldolase
MPTSPIDLRSDTVTRPTPAMRRAMAEAEVGDDVYREDPTVRRLEEKAAAMLGKAAALFVPTGTMGNQIAIKVWTRPGQEVVIEERSHIYNYEMAQMAAFSGVMPRVVPGSAGIPSAEAVERAFRSPIYYIAQTGLLALENTHNMAGGSLLPQAVAESLAGLARSRGIPVHLDGARLFNAAVALGRPAAELAKPFDSVMFCLSKGLGAPVGSLLAGDAAFIDEALRVRKRLGGGMRQVGVLAAAGLVALDHQVTRLAEDHALARRLAERLAAIEGCVIDPSTVVTNIVIFKVRRRGLTALQVSERLRALGVLMLTVEDDELRAVTHYDVRPGDIEIAADRVAAVLAA